MGPEVGFVTGLATTVGMLIGAAITGRKRRISAHVKFAGAAVLSLTISIYFAIELGKVYDVSSAGRITPIHLGLAKFTTAMYLWPLITGPLAHRGKIPKRVHRIGAWFALFLTVAATVTGVIMLANSDLR